MNHNYGPPVPNPDPRPGSYGWQCPRCGVVYAPNVQSCRCSCSTPSGPKITINPPLPYILPYEVGDFPVPPPFTVSSGTIKMDPDSQVMWTKKDVPVDDSLCGACWGTGKISNQNTKFHIQKCGECNGTGIHKKV